MRWLSILVLWSAADVAQAVPIGEPVPGELAVGVEPTWARGMPTQGLTARRWLLFTFDDGPRPETTGPIARILLRERVPAVFFVNGEHLQGETVRAQRSRALVAWLARRGFTIGNHGLRHRHLGSMDHAEAYEEIVGNEELLRRLTGRTPWLFRPPYGAMTRIAHAICTRRGLTHVGWTMGADDTVAQTPAGVLARFKSNLALLERRGIRGGVLVLHDPQPWTATALSHVLAWLRDRNCELLSQGEELYELVDFDRFWTPRLRDVGPDEFVRAPEPTAAEAAAWQRRVRAEAARRCAQR